MRKMVRRRFFGEIVNFDSGYKIGAHMQSRWENYCRIFTELSQFRAKRLYFTESVNLYGFLV